MSDHKFKLQINFTKAYTGEDNAAYIEGIASGPEVDLTNERMSETALVSMVESLKKRLIEFRDVHSEEWNSDLGEVVELSLTSDNQLFYKAKLDLNLSGAKDLWYRITEQGKKLGVSIGGSVVKAGYEYAAELGRSIYTYFDVDLTHIGITRQAAYQHSFANAVTKSLPKKEEPMSTSTEVEKTEDHEEVVESQDTNLTEPEAAVTDAEENAHNPTETSEEESKENTDDAAAEADADAEESQDESTETDVEKSTDATDEQSEEAADDETPKKEVAKSAVFGDWAEISLVTSAIERLSWTLQDHVWSALYDDEKSAQEKLASIAAGLDDYKSLILKVATALVQDGNTEDVKRAAEAFKASAPDAVAKSLTEKDTKVEELTKSLSDKTDELETVQKSLAEATTKLETIEARKTLAFQSGAKSAVLVDQEVEKSANNEPSIGELYYQKIGALPEAA